MVLRQIVSKSLGYVSIIAMSVVAMFVIIMDILKYCVGIDPVAEEQERTRKKKRKAWCKPVTKRFTYVPAPRGSPWPKASVSMIRETVI